MVPPTVSTILSSIAARRTIYNLKPVLPTGINLKDVQKIIQAIIKDTPTAFNSQPNRALILTGEAHRKIWEQVTDSIEAESGKKRPASVKNEAFGSVIFLTDDQTTENLQAKFPAWAAFFPTFASHASGAAQISSWTTLEAAGLGCHLQHYNGYIKAALGSKIPSNWTVQAQLIFGVPKEQPGEKTYIENEVKVISVL
ncbi:probable Putative nitroreductase HBN1 [Saccharomycodes ludwigii]|uniref:Probable Putative nitroreductase HBN1 n=1 Tax=Saccharomycodes ludwigii TaxID=36035 RepID=A0A376B2P5_9ASCO|nr:hypothetical protein SCDLUD_003856 [Saccharomycodes ludwigii]KAH3899576.1 hypothetical protein SCDLUD_003856 [Saccharomycodes ludwigii]SSD58947.1 probable Putative nitroreductase HBN1 [Saccharomycodes ludwigii]